MFSTRPPAASTSPARRRDTEYGLSRAPSARYRQYRQAIRRSVALGRFDAGLRLNNAGAGGLDGGAGGGDSGFRRLQRRAGAFCRGAIVIQLLAETGAALRQGILSGRDCFPLWSRAPPDAASQLLRWRAFHFAADRAGSGGRQDRAFRFLDLRGGFKTLLVQYTGIHSRQHLSSARTDPL